MNLLISNDDIMIYIKLDERIFLIGTYCSYNAISKSSRKYYYIEDIIETNDYRAFKDTFNGLYGLQDELTVLSYNHKVVK